MIRGVVQKEVQVPYFNSSSARFEEFCTKLIDRDGGLLDIVRP
jgi:hypothetical protein